MRKKRHSAEGFVNKLREADKKVTPRWGRDETGSQLIREENRIVRWGESTVARRLHEQRASRRNWGDNAPHFKPPNVATSREVRSPAITAKQRSIDIVGPSLRQYGRDLWAPPKKRGLQRSRDTLRARNGSVCTIPFHHAAELERCEPLKIARNRLKLERLERHTPFVGKCAKPAAMATESPVKIGRGFTELMSHDSCRTPLDASNLAESKSKVDILTTRFTESLVEPPDALGGGRINQDARGDNCLWQSISHWRIQVALFSHISG